MVGRWQWHNQVRGQGGGGCGGGGGAGGRRGGGAMSNIPLPTDTFEEHTGRPTMFDKRCV